MFCALLKNHTECQAEWLGKKIGAHPHPGYKVTEFVGVFNPLQNLRALFVK